MRKCTTCGKQVGTSRENPICQRVQAQYQDGYRFLPGSYCLDCVGPAQHVANAPFIDTPLPPRENRIGASGDPTRGS